MSVDVILDDGFKYHFNGEDVTAKLIRIAPFSMKQLDKADPIREIYSHSMANMQMRLTEEEKAEIEKAQEIAADKAEKADKKEEKEKKLEVADGKALLSLFRMHCDKGDASRMSLYMKALLTSGVAYIDGENDHKLNGANIDDMTPGDFDKLAGEYLGNFINS